MSAISIMQEDEVQNTEAIAQESGFGCVSTTRGNLPVKAMDVRTKIVGLIAETVVRQTYQNAFNEPLEATYIFPLPDRGAVSDFKMIVGSRVIDGEIKERGQARRDYQQAIDAGHRASIVEEERPDTFTMRVGNVDAGEEITIEFKVTGPLIFADGEATFRFPLVVAPRYIPGAPLAGGNVGDGVATDTDAVPDASRISPPVLLPSFPSPIALHLECEIRGGGMQLSNLRSSLHAVTMSQGDGVHHISVRPGERLNRDFILRFDVGTADVTTSLDVVRDANGGAGTFMLTLVPPALNASPVPRDVVFVLDRSGSMGGWKMVAARRALGRMLDTLGPKDRFQVIAFDNAVEPFTAGMQDATNRNRYRAIEKLGGIDARGGTEMARPLYEAMDLLGGGYRDRRRMLVLVTDGQVGNEDQIVRELQRRDNGTTLLTVGIDQAVNAGFLNRLAAIGGGRCELVESEDRLDEAMDRIHRVIATPVLTEVSLSLGDMKSPWEQFTPSRTPDLYEGSPVMIYGRFNGEVPTIEVTAAQSDGSKWSTSVRGHEVSSQGITAIWARQLVREMEDTYAKSSDSRLSEKITAHSIRFGVLCRFTSWVAVDRASKIESKGDLRQVVQPVEQPAGWGSAAASAPPPPMMAPAPAPAQGPGAPQPRRRMAPQAQSASASYSRGGGAFDADDDDAFDGMLDEEVAMPAPEAPRQDMAPRQEMAKEGGLRMQKKGAPAKAKRVFAEAPGMSSDEVRHLLRLAVALLMGAMPSDTANLAALVRADGSVDGRWCSVFDAEASFSTVRQLLEALVRAFPNVGTGQARWPYNTGRLQGALAQGRVAAEPAALVMGWLCIAVIDGTDAGDLVPTDIHVESGTGLAYHFQETPSQLGTVGELLNAPTRREFWK